MNCQKCGKVVDEGTEACPRCNEKISLQNPQSEDTNNQITFTNTSKSIYASKKTSVKKKPVLITVIIVGLCLISWIAWNSYFTTYSDIDKLARNGDTQKILSILSYTDEHHPFPNAIEIKQHALDKLHEVNKDEFLSFGSGILFYDKNQDISPEYVVALAQVDELENLIYSSINKLGYIDHTGIKNPNLKLIIDKLSTESPSSEAIKKVESEIRTEKIKEVTSELSSLLAYTKEIDNVSDYFVSELKSYGLWDDSLEKTLAAYNTNKGLYDEYRSKISSAESQITRNEAAIKDTNTQISMKENDLNSSALNVGYASLSGYVVAQIGQGIEFDGRKWAEYEIIVAGGPENGQRGILRSYLGRFSTKGYFQNIAIQDWVGLREVITVDGFYASWPVYFEIDSLTAQGNIQSQNNQRQQIQNEINQLRQTVTNYQKEIDRERATIKQLASEFQPIKNRHEDLHNQWNTQISSKEKLIKDLAIKIVDGA